MSISSTSSLSPNPRKRGNSDLDSSGGVGITPPTHTLTSHNSISTSVPLSTSINGLGFLGSCEQSEQHARFSSPALSSNGSIISTIEGPGTNTSENPTSKRRKLTVAEKAEKQREKEMKEQMKAAQRQKKEEEKQAKDGERRKRDEEKEEKRKLKDEEKRRRDEEAEERRSIKEEEKKRKEEEKQKLEDEKRKKERSQMRLNAFFPSRTKAEPVDCSNSAAATTLMPTEESDQSLSALPLPTTPSPQKPISSPRTTQRTEFERAFPPFFVQSHVSLAPTNRFSRDAEGKRAVTNLIDAAMSQPQLNPDARSTNKKFSIAELCHLPPHKSCKRTLPQLPTIKEIISQRQGTADRPVDLSLNSNTSTLLSSSNKLALVPIKYLQYAEDVRPPYRGTFTKRPTRLSGLATGRNPFLRSLPKMNYDYDSEAEWEEPDPEDGEDLDSEGEEEAGSDEEGDDMEGFLDDENSGDGSANAASKRRQIIGELEPSCSGLCWEDYSRDQGVYGSEKANFDLGQYRMELILEDLKTPIDPFSTKYWHQLPSTSASTTNQGDKLHKIGSARNAMDPPRIPLQTSGISSGTLHTFGSVNAKLPRRLIAQEQLEEFKLAIAGSDLTKAGLVEVLKKKFPKTSKDVIKDTLNAVASRVGVKEADKRWIIISGP
ncbi:MAG: hypothetical protein M1833_001832 [Piccolia ochrophora]|nr:MAG: hypothetical protein M1833_001832 [Piccolia ochrophora]